MKIYTVIDNAKEILVTTDRLKALEAAYELMQKYEDKQSWFWVAEGKLK